MSLRLAVILAGLAAVFAVLAGVYWKGRADGSARERPKIEAAEGRAAVATLETEGARASAQRVTAAVRQRQVAVRIANDLTLEALKAEDADAPLDLDRAARLRAADRELCLEAAHLCPTDSDAR